MKNNFLEERDGQLLHRSILSFIASFHFYVYNVSLLWMEGLLHTYAETQNQYFFKKRTFAFSNQNFVLGQINFGPNPLTRHSNSKDY